VFRGMMRIVRGRPGIAGRRWLPALACALALAAGTQAAAPAQPAAAAQAPGAPAAASADATAVQGAAVKASAGATLEQCVTSTQQLERSATFVGEMTVIPGTARMLMRIEVLERVPHEALFHQVSYPGLGQWLRAAPGVRTYKNLDKVTDLSAPADYRAAVHFRWLNAKGRLIRSQELRTGRCVQPAAPAPTPAGSTAPTASGG